MNKINVKNTLLTTSAICVIGVFSNNATAEEFAPTRGNDAAYTVEKVSSCQEGVSTTGGCFKTVSGHDESGNPIYQYYTYTVTISNDKKATRATTADEINKNTTSGKSYIGITYEEGSFGAQGGAIDNNFSGDITTLTGDFIGNYVSDEYAYAGAISNIYTNIITLTGDFIGNYALTTGSSSYAYGGAIYMETGVIDTLTGNFIGNYAKSNSSEASGGAIYNSNSTINTLTGDFIGNYVLGTGSSSDALGGAIYNRSSTIDTLTGDFIGNYAQSSSSGALGGAIYNEYGTITLVADARDDAYEDDILFQGNYVQKGSDAEQYEAIYNRYSSSTMTFKSRNNGSYTFYDYINGDGSATVNFTAENGTGTLNLYNDIKGQANINFQNDYVLNMLSPDDIHEGTSALSFIGAKNITISAAIQMVVDVDLANLKMDRFEAENFTINNGGSLEITTFNLLSDAASKTANVPFIVLAVDEQSGEPVGAATGLENLIYVTSAIYGATTYDVEFDEEKGEFVFTKATPTPVGPSEEETTASEVNAASSNSTQTSVDALNSKLVNREVNRNVLSVQGISSGDEMIATTWVEVFGSDDDVELKNLSGTIDTQFYGIIGGVDSKKFTYDNGLQAMYGVYGAYTRSKQKYDGNKITQNGGYLGLSVALYKDALFNNVSLNGGYLKNEADTKFGKDKFDTKVISIANKTGVDIKKNELTFTPALSLGYTGIDTEDYTAKSGVKVKNTFMNVFTVAPELKVAKDFGTGLEGYAKTAYRMFFYDNNKVKANDVLLPSMSVKPYVDYGVGLTKDWSQEEWNAKDITSYAEIARHDGGREGWNVNLGLKFDF